MGHMALGPFSSNPAVISPRMPARSRCSMRFLPYPSPLSKPHKGRCRESLRITSRPPRITRDRCSKALWTRYVSVCRIGLTELPERIRRWKDYKPALSPRSTARDESVREVGGVRMAHAQVMEVREV